MTIGGQTISYYGTNGGWLERRAQVAPATLCRLSPFTDDPLSMQSTAATEAEVVSWPRRPRPTSKTSRAPRGRSWTRKRNRQQLRQGLTEAPQPQPQLLFRRETREVRSELSPREDQGCDFGVFTLLQPHFSLPRPRPPRLPNRPRPPRGFAPERTRAFQPCPLAVPFPLLASLDLLRFEFSIWIE